MNKLVSTIVLLFFISNCFCGHLLPLSKLIDELDDTAFSFEEERPIHRKHAMLEEAWDCADCTTQDRKICTHGGTSKDFCEKVCVVKAAVENPPCEILPDAKLNKAAFKNFDATAYMGESVLPRIGFPILKRTGCFDDEAIFNVLVEAQKLYRNVPYHSATHAADVTQALYSFLLINRNAALELTTTEKCALLVAAISHDLGHDGRNNAHHLLPTSLSVAVGIPKPVTAIRELIGALPNKGIQEYYHAIQFLALVVKTKLWGAPKADDNTWTLNGDEIALIRMILTSIIETDMSLHFHHIALSANPDANFKFSNENPKGAKELGETRMATLKECAKKLINEAENPEDDLDAVKALRTQVTSIINQVSESFTALNANTPAHVAALKKESLASLILHLADISNPLRSFSIAAKWSLKMIQESNEQIAAEIDWALKSGIMTGATDVTKVSGGQTGFLNGLYGAYAKNVEDKVLTNTELQLDAEKASNTLEWQRFGGYATIIAALPLRA